MRKNFIEDQLKAHPITGEQNTYSERNMMRAYLTEELRGLYWTEKYLLKNLPKLQSVASRRELQEALEDHSSVTDDHVERIEQVFTLLNDTVQVRKCEPMDAMLKEISHLCFKLEQNDFTKDFAIVAALKKMQHYQVSVYGNLIHIVKLLRKPFIEAILQRSLNDEVKATEVFSSIVKTYLNETNLLETENE